MFTTVFGFKFFSLGYIYLFILACAHTRVHRPLPRHRGQRTTCRNQSPPSTVCTLGFGLTLPHFTQRCLTSLASAYGVWGIGLRPSCLCGKHFLTMLSLRQECFLEMALPSPGVLEQQTLVPSHPLHRADEGFFSQSPFHGLILCPAR